MDVGALSDAFLLWEIGEVEVVTREGKKYNLLQNDEFNLYPSRLACPSKRAATS